MLESTHARIAFKIVLKLIQKYSISVYTFNSFSMLESTHAMIATECAKSFAKHDELLKNWGL